MIGFKISTDSLTITRGCEDILAYRLGQVMLSAAVGNASFKMTRGSFTIRDKVRDMAALKICDFMQTEKDEVYIKLTEGGVKLRFSGDLIRFTPLHLSKYNRLFITLPARRSEHVYGAGETFSEFDLRGNKFNVWVAEHQNMGVISRKLAHIAFGDKDSQRKMKLGKYETYYAQPTFLSSEKYFFHSETPARAVFDFTQPYTHTIETDSIASWYLGYGDTFEDVLSSLTSVVGRQPELPDWVYDGYILGIQGGTEILLNKVQKALDAGIRVNGAWIQDWEGRRITAAGKQLMWNWEYDPELYPDLPDVIASLASRGIKTLGYCNPFLAIEKPLYKIASENGYCVKDKYGADYLVTITTFPAAMVDLTNPEAWEWLKGIIKTNMIGIGLAGWMADFGEYLPTDCVLHSGEKAELVHNTWPARWAKLNREVLEETGKLGEIFFFTRAGNTDTPRYSTMMWNGDNHVDFSLDNGIASVIPASLSLTCSGFGLQHSDIAGYTTFGQLRRSEELYLRWAEMNAYTPVMRGHEGINPDINVQLDHNERVLAAGAAASRIHAELKPYIKEAVRYNSETGVGVIRPLFFHYDEPEAYTNGYEYLLGRDILVAPVLHPGAQTNRVYLPRDKWLHIPGGKIYEGGIYNTIPAPIGSVPAFVRLDADKQTLEAAARIKEIIDEYSFALTGNENK